MLYEQGIVVDVDDQHAWVKVERRSSCESCAVQKGCGTSVLSKVVGKKIATIRVANVLQAKIGDQVSIAVDENALVSGALVLYGLPLLGMFILAMLAHVLLQNELLTMLSAAMGLLSSFIFLHYLGKKSIIKSRFQATMKTIEQQNAPHFSIDLLS